MVSFFQVIYADYGNKAIVNPLDLRLLRQEFIELPAMCIKGSLAKIRPLQSVGKSVFMFIIVDSSR